jgi:acetylxylan esterase
MRFLESVLGLSACAGGALGALTQVTGFGTNPTGVQMFISVPAKVATNPAIIVAVCVFFK